MSMKYGSENGVLDFLSRDADVVVRFEVLDEEEILFLNADELFATLV